MDFISVEEAKARVGVRLVVSRGIPVPWSEGAKGILHVKEIAHARVAHEPARDNREISSWTGIHNAPILIVDNEKPLDRWAQILVRLEELKPEPRLIPEAEADRALMFGYIHELLDVDGYVWNRRLWLNAQAESINATLPKESIALLQAKYGARNTDQPLNRIKQIVVELGRRLREQEVAGSRYFIGPGLTAIDIYWAVTCGLAKPLPEDVCPFADQGIRFNYTERVPEILAAMDPILFEHRDYIYRTYLELPMRL